MKTFALLAVLCLVTGCAGVAHNGDRSQIATADWGLDVKTTPAGQLDRVYIEGAPGGSFADDWTATTGTSPDRRPYFKLQRKHTTPGE